MSTPSPNYYYKETGSDTYHWEMSCKKNHYPSSGWVATRSAPSGREQCNECKSK